MLVKDFALHTRGQAHTPWMHGTARNAPQRNAYSGITLVPLPVQTTSPAPGQADKQMANSVICTGVGGRQGEDRGEWALCEQ